MKPINDGGGPHAPTEWAYNKACEALEAQRARAEEAEAELATLKAERERLREVLLKYQGDLCEGYCGDASWEDKAHAHPDFQRECGGCLAAATLLNAALGDA